MSETGIVYKIVSWLYSKQEKRFQPKIPAELRKLVKPFGLNLELMRFYGKVLSTEQVDELLDRSSFRNDNIQRMAVKNQLLTCRLMEPGIVEPTEQDPVTRVWCGGESLRLNRYQRWKRRGGWQQYRFRWTWSLQQRIKQYLHRRSK